MSSEVATDGRYEVKRAARVLRDLAARLESAAAEDLPEIATELLTESCAMYRAITQTPENATVTVTSPKRWARDLVRRLAGGGLA